MAEDKSTQTQYANPDTGEVPVAQPSGNIVRDNPYGQSSFQNPMQAPQLANPTAGMTPPVIPPTSPAVTTPLPTGAPYNNALIQNLQERKDIFQKQGENLGQGAEEQARIQQAAAEEQRKSVENSRLAMEKALADATARDMALRAEVAKAAKEKPLTDADVWHNKSTGSKILAGIGIFLGGLGGGLQKTGRNPAMEIINKSIDSEISASKEQIANHWKSIAETHGLDNDIYNRELHRQVWENNFRNAALERVKLELASSGARTQSISVRNNAAIGVNDIEQEQLKLRNNTAVLGQQQLLAQQARMQKLSDQADSDVQKLVEGGKYSYDDALAAVYARPKYQVLQSPTAHRMGFGGAELASPQLKAEFQAELGKQIAQANLLGVKPGDPKYNAIMDVVIKDPKYAPITHPGPIGEPPDLILKREGKSDTAQQHFDFQLQKDLRERTVTLDGRKYVAGTSKEADDAAKKIASLNEVQRVIKGINDIRERNKDSWYMDSTDRAALDELLRQGTLHYPLAMTGSLRINPEELKKGSQTFAGEGDWFRTDMLNKKKSALDTLNTQLEERKRELMQGLVPADQQSAGAANQLPAAGTPAGNVGLSGKSYGNPVK